MLTENILEEQNQVRTISDNGITLVKERIVVLERKKKISNESLKMQNNKEHWYR